MTAAVDETLPFPPQLVAQRLCAWYAHSGRDLPWRKTRDPYRIWLSEIMLQQTTVAAVIDYYQRFLARFPTVQSLAAASLDEVLTLWAGLGYYSRARNLHQAAQQVVCAGDGRFPASSTELQRLPGVGRSTAGAILCLAFDQPAAVLDGNVRRVLCRLLAIRAPAREVAVEKRLWAVAAQLVPPVAAHDYTQAVMDLGATVCTPKRPACAQCPLADICQARAAGIATLLPVAAKRPVTPLRQQAIVLIDGGGQKLLQRRPAEGLLGGMLEFPTVALPTAATAADTVAELLAGYGCHRVPLLLGSIRHTYSHFRLEAQVFLAACCPKRLNPDAGLFWQPDAELDGLALHGAHKKPWL